MLIYMLFSASLSASIVGLVGTGRMQAGDPRLGLLLVGSLFFVAIQQLSGDEFSSAGVTATIMLTLRVVLDTARRYLDR